MRRLLAPLLIAIHVYAAPLPSRVAADSRPESADVAKIAARLAQLGCDKAHIARITQQLRADEAHALVAHLERVQTAGLTTTKRVIIIAAVVVLVFLVLLGAAQGSLASNIG